LNWLVVDCSITYSLVAAVAVDFVARVRKQLLQESWSARPDPAWELQLAWVDLLASASAVVLVVVSGVA
jgi:hypothetical protein